MQVQDSSETTQAPQAEGTAGAQSALETHKLYRLGQAYGRQVYRFRWAVIGFWAVVLLISLPFTAKLGTVLKSGGFSFSGSESVKVSDALVNTLHYPPSSLFVVFHAENASVTDPAYQQEVSDLRAKIKGFAHVTSVTAGGVSQDGHTTFLVVAFDQGPDYMQNQLPDFRKLLPTGAASSPASIYLTGNLPVYSEFDALSQSDTEKADGAALPIALLVLLIVFGTFVAAILPLLLALVAVPVALALVYAVALHQNMNVIVLSVASIIGLGLSIDYSLFLVRRFRDELAQDRTVPEAVGWTIATSGEAILFSGLTVMVGFSGLLLIGVPFMTSFGIGGMLVVASAVLAALTLLPALLGVMGLRVNRLRIPFIGRLTAPRSDEHKGERQGFWHAWALGVMKRPIIIVVLVSIVLIGLAWPALSMQIGLPDATSLPSTSESRQGLAILNRQFPATAQDPVYLLVQTRDGSSMLTAGNLAKLNSLTRWLAQQQHITSVTSLTQLPATPGTPAPSQDQLMQLYTTGAYQQNPALAQFVTQTTNGGTTLITAIANTKLDSDAGNALIDSLRAGDQAAAQGLSVAVGGTQAITLDFNRFLYSRFPLAIIFILIATFLLLLVMFRSVLIPLKAVLMNVLSIGAAYGVLVFVFQWGHFSSALGFTSEGFIESTTPITMFCVLFGLSMDYEVFLLSRIREEWLRSGNNRHAVALGLEKTGSVITNAALIFIIVAGAITFTTLVTTKEIGLGMAVAVFVDATIVRSLLVPATMRLLGRWNWWLPGRPVPVERPL